MKTQSEFLKGFRACLFLSFLLLPFHFAFAADPASTNFSVAESWYAAGGGNAQSTDYKVEESSIDSYGKGSLSSTHYGLEGKVGIKGTEQIPYISSITPANYSKFFTDESASFTVAASTPDGDTLQYLAKQDSTTKDGAQSSNVLTWSLSGSDLGRHVIDIQVIDPQGTTLQKQDAYVARRPTK